ncbi:MAG: hypothetical protein E7555_04190 [Ruminococcaceae bacterium]|nr:hypothetical protein [Oscillospiraceae bacterium]
MKNKIISITALILAIALFILTGCNAEKEPEAETTTKESLSATITQAETTADSDKEETEVVSEIVTNDEGETEIITEIVTKSEEATTKKNSDKTENTTAKKNFTTKEIVEMFNTSANRIKTDASKVVKNFEKRIVNEDKTDIPSAMGSVAESMMASMMGDDTEPIPFTGKDEIIENFIVPQQSYVSKLSPDYVVKAECKDKGNTYEIYLKLKDHKNPTAGIGVGAVCDVIETHEIAQKASFIKEFSTTYYNCEIKATMDKATGKITHIVYTTPLVMNMTVNLLGTHSGSIGFTFIKDYTVTY